MILKTVGLMVFILSMRPDAVLAQASLTPEREPLTQRSSRTRQAVRVVDHASKPRGPLKRTALVIGNQAYQAYPLTNPNHDAKAIAQALKELGFKLIGGGAQLDLNQRKVKRLLLDFKRTLKRDQGVGLFYYAGHGLQVGGQSYIVPIGAQIDHSDYVEVEAVSIDEVMNAMRDVGASIKIIILDACRAFPIAGSARSATQGLAMPKVPSGSLIAYATAPGQVASDGAGQHGTYTGAILRHIHTAGLPIEALFKRVRAEVESLTEGRQIPWESSSLTGDFTFKAGATCQVECRPSCDSECLDSLVVRREEEEERALNEELKRRAQSMMSWVTVPEGSFTLSRHQDDASKRPESPQEHEIEVSALQIASAEITVEQYRLCVEALVCTPPQVNSYWRGELSCNWSKEGSMYWPMNCISWSQARTFSKWIGGDLPTEAQWLYAALGGAELDDAERANPYELGHFALDGHYTVAQKTANRYGLYDVQGEVAEWVLDEWHAHRFDIPRSAERAWGSNPLCEGECAPSERFHIALRGTEQTDRDLHPGRLVDPETLSEMGGSEFRGYEPHIGVRPVRQVTSRSDAHSRSSSHDQAHQAHQTHRTPPCQGSRAGCPDLKWVRFPQGSFEMGFWDPERSNASPRHRVNVGCFELTQTEITMREYRLCVQDQSCTAPNAVMNHMGVDEVTRDPRCLWTDEPSIYEDYPINCVSWAQLYRFAIWAGGRLPSEAEWEYAARGGGREVIYPWGDESPRSSHAAISSTHLWYANDLAGPRPVCSYPLDRSPQGLCDLAGNVGEWVLDEVHDDYFEAPQDGSAWCDDVPCQLTPYDPKILGEIKRGELAEVTHVSRGGSWSEDASTARVTHRTLDSLVGRTESALGGRIARTCARLPSD